MAYRIALLGIYHESNTFIDSPTTLGDFVNGHWLKGEAIRQEYKDAHHEIGGMLEAMDECGAEVVPVMFAEATPGGIVAPEAYDTLLGDMLDGLARAMPIDGCLVVPHGAGVSTDERDMDGHWLELVRKCLGPNVPMMGTLDLHANISARMVQATDALVAYRQNPHLDQRARGKEAGQLLIACLNGKIKPLQYLVQAPLAVSIEQQLTDAEPCKSLYEKAKALSDRSGILSISVALGFPYADVQEMGTSIVVVADGNKALAVSVARELECYLMENRKQYVGQKINVEKALVKLKEMAKPVLLLDMGDNIGGGSPGNGLSLVRALERVGCYRYFSYQYDPDVVEEASRHTIGTSFEIVVHGVDYQGMIAEKLYVTLQSVVDGKFREEAPRHGGQAQYNMGKTVILETERGGTLMCSSLRIPPFSLKQLTAFGLQPERFDVLVAKGVNAPVAAYGPVCKSIIQVDTPGVTQADMTRFHYENRRKPLYPFEVDE